MDNAVALYFEIICAIINLAIENCRPQTTATVIFLMRLNAQISFASVPTRWDTVMHWHRSEKPRIDTRESRASSSLLLMLTDCGAHV